MRSSIASLAPLALLAGTALSSPIVERGDLATITALESITDLANFQPQPTSTPGESTVTIHVYVYVFEPESTPPPTTQVQSLIVPTSTIQAVASPPPSSPSGDVDSSTLASINKWRSAYGLAPYQWSDEDASLAAQCGQDNKNNGAPVHTHFESGGQVIAPGTDVVVGDFEGLTPFEIALAAWLCEKPQESQISGLCQTLAQIGTAAGTIFAQGGTDTAHHDLILSTEFSTVGCAYTARTSTNPPLWAGYWICNLGN